MQSAKIVLTATLITLILLASVAVYINGTGTVEAIHCSLGIISGFILIGAFLTGPLLKGRLGRMEGVKTLSVHLWATLLMSVYLTGLFIYGIIMAEEINIFSTTHGILGFLVVLTSWTTVASSPCFHKKAANRQLLTRAHKVLAVLLIFFIAAQVLYSVFIMGG